MGGESAAEQGTGDARRALAAATPQLTTRGNERAAELDRRRQKKGQTVASEKRSAGAVARVTLPSTR